SRGRLPCRTGYPLSEPRDVLIVGADRARLVAHSGLMIGIGAFLASSAACRGSGRIWCRYGSRSPCSLAVDRELGADMPTPTVIDAHVSGLDGSDPELLAGHPCALDPRPDLG